MIINEYKCIPPLLYYVLHIIPDFCVIWIDVPHCMLIELNSQLFASLLLINANMSRPRQHYPFIFEREC